MREPIIPEMSHPTSVCPDPSKWHAFDDMTTELEVLEFLTALVVMMKPKIVIETGCYKGYGTQALFNGMSKNGFGSLYTCDMGMKEVVDTSNRIGPTTLTVRIIQCSGVEMIEKHEGIIDFAFLDSGPDEIRCHELKALYPKLSPGGVVAIHDSGIQGFLREKYLPPLLRELDMQHVFFDTPRGLTVCRKRPEIYP